MNPRKKIKMLLRK